MMSVCVCVTPPAPHTLLHRLTPKSTITTPPNVHGFCFATTNVQDVHCALPKSTYPASHSSCPLSAHFLPFSFVYALFSFIHSTPTPNPCVTTTSSGTTPLAVKINKPASIKVFIASQWVDFISLFGISSSRSRRLCGGVRKRRNLDFCQCLMTGLRSRKLQAQWKHRFKNILGETFSL